MYHYYLSLGSNLENKYLNICKAVEALRKLRDTKLKQSSFYISEPQNYTNQDEFINICVSMDSKLNPFEFLDKVKKIEKKIGRKPSHRFGPRLIDIDIIWVKGVKIISNNLEIPHPRAFERAFVLHPLKEIVSGDKELLNYINNSLDDVSEQGINKISEYKLKKMF